MIVDVMGRMIVNVVGTEIEDDERGRIELVEFALTDVMNDKLDL